MDNVFESFGISELAEVEIATEYPASRDICLAVFAKALTVINNSPSENCEIVRVVDIAKVAVNSKVNKQFFGIDPCFLISNTDRIEVEEQQRWYTTEISRPMFSSELTYINSLGLSLKCPL